MNLKFGKIAICISGLARTAIPAHICFKNFFGHLDADVFYHSWDIDTPTVDSINELYRPKKCLVQPQFPKEEMGSFGSMLYSIMMANELKKDYEIEHNFRYSLVIKTRFDLVFPQSHRFPYHFMMPRTIYSSGGALGYVSTDYETHAINDVIFWGDSESMDIATNVYMYYKHKSLYATSMFLNGLKEDPVNYFYSVGNLIYDYCSKRNIALTTFVQGINEIPWRTDISHLDPIKDYDKIVSRYKQL